MNSVLVDANVLIDLATGDPVWAEWSAQQLGQLSDRTLLINPVIYAEVSIRYRSVEQLEAVLPPELERHNLPWDAAFQAGKAFAAYRRRGGERRSPLPDFFIGAHAAVMGHDLLTRDARRYRTYFPTVRLIAPEAD